MMRSGFSWFVLVCGSVYVVCNAREGSFFISRESMTGDAAQMSGHKLVDCT